MMCGLLMFVLWVFSDDICWLYGIWYSLYCLTCVFALLGCRRWISMVCLINVGAWVVVSLDLTYC